MAQVVVRTPLQDWTKFTGYLPDSLWMQLTSDDKSSSEKMQLLFRFFIPLGLRCPSAPTNQALTAFYLIVSEGLEVAAAMTCVVKFDAFCSAKKMFKGLADKAGAMVDICTCFPDDPEVFRQSFPAARVIVYDGSETFVQPVAIKHYSVDF